MTYDVRVMERGKCGRCGGTIQSQYLWCDDCEDLVVRDGMSPFWIDREVPAARHGDALSGGAGRE